MTKKEVIDFIFDKLSVYKPYIMSKNRSGGTIIKLQDTRLLSIRIAYTSTDVKYQYRWNIIKDYKQVLKGKYGAYQRSYYPWNLESLNLFLVHFDKLVQRKGVKP